MKKTILASTLSAGIASVIVSGNAFAAADYTLNIGTPGTPSAANSGSVRIGIDGYGGFGLDDFDSRTIGSADLTTTIRNQPTTRTSFVAARFGANPQAGQLAGAAQYIGSGFGIETDLGDFFPAPGGTFTPVSATANRVETSFSSADLANLDFRLVQTTNRFDTNPSGTTSGSLIQQDYEFTNNTGQSISGELLRYASFSLNFSSGSQTTGGGHVIRGGKDYLIATQDISIPTSNTVYTAISAEILGTGNPDPTNNRFEFGLSTDTEEHVLDTSLSGPLTDAVRNNDGSGLTSALSSYGLAFRNSFTIANGETLTYRTTTYWGIGSIANFNPPTGGSGSNPIPAPGTLALLGLAGFGLIRFRKRIPA